MGFRPERAFGMKVPLVVRPTATPAIPKWHPVTYFEAHLNGAALCTSRCRVPETVRSLRVPFSESLSWHVVCTTQSLSMRLTINTTCYNLLLKHTLLPSTAFGALQDAQKIDDHDEYMIECSLEDAEVFYETVRKHFPGFSIHIEQAISAARSNAIQRYRYGSGSRS